MVLGLCFHLLALFLRQSTLEHPVPLRGNGGGREKNDPTNFGIGDRTTTTTTLRRLAQRDSFV